MTTIEFETAALSDCFKAAVRIAPKVSSKNLEMAGLMIQARKGMAIVRSTNGDVRFRQVLVPIEFDGKPVQWRLPAQVAARVIASLPVKRGSRVTMTQEGRAVRVRSGRMTATMALMDHREYPHWDPLPMDDAPVISGFGKHLGDVTWATERSTDLAGSCVRVDGSSIVAATTKAVARSECEVPLGAHDSALLPLAVLTPILSQMVDCKVAFDGSLFAMQPSDDVQIQTSTLEVSFPNVGIPMGRKFDGQVPISRQQAAEVLARVRAIVDSDIEGHVWLVIGAGRVSFFSTGAGGANSVTDILDLDEGLAPHDPVQLRMSAETLSLALGRSPGDVLTIRYDTTGKSHMFRVDGTGGYSCWIPLIMQGGANV